MKGEWTSIVLGGVAAGCGIYVRVRLWGDMPEELGFTIYSMIFLGLLIMLMNIREMIKEKGDIMPIEKDSFPIKCSLCESAKGLRIVNEGGILRLVCIDCEDLDEKLDANAIFDCFMGIVKYSADNQGLDHDTLTDIIHEKFDLPVYEEEEKKDKGDASE